jgi:hypothetical protein
MGTVLFGQSSGQEKSHADHMEHRFEAPPCFTVGRLADPGG